MPLSIYFLPGHGGRISNGLGQELGRRGFDVMGRETLGDFKKLRFDAQVETVAEDLKASFWHHDALVLANSYGAYLLLQALSLSESFPGKVLLLSPIVGEFSNEKPAWVSFHPMPKGFKNWLKAANFHCPDAAKSMLGQKTGKAFQTT